MKSRICLSLMLVSGMLFPGMATAKETIHYFHNDHLGTPLAMSDQSGTIVWKAEYEPFGTAVVDEDPDGDGIAVTCNLRFPGQYFDSETGLHYNYHRDYDPSTGSYLEADPIGLEGGGNLYIYAFNNPINSIDPTGEYTIPWPVIEPAADKLLGFLGGAIGAIIGAAIGDAISKDCDNPCPPCRLVDGASISIGTISYDRHTHPISPKHGIVGDVHLHAYECHQNPSNCWCFWRSIRINGKSHLQPPPLPTWIAIKPFVNPPY